MDNDPKASDTHNFIEIKKIDDIVPFIGKVVAYKTDSPHFGLHKEHYPFFNDNSLRFGYISKLLDGYGVGELGCNLDECLCANEIQSTSAICNSILAQAFLSVRCTTNQEKIIILNALNSGAVKFAYHRFYKDELMKALTEH